MADAFKGVIALRPAHETATLRAVVGQLRWFAGPQIRNGWLCAMTPDLCEPMCALGFRIWGSHPLGCGQTQRRCPKNDANKLPPSATPVVFPTPQPA
eukprot:366469-Chlamydomonas_euryale.AAC.9